jgi:nicotinate-nucleotide pyrophosphorylase (carboxylating)
MIDPGIGELVARALSEDIGLRDLTTEAIVQPGRSARGTIEQREPGALYGFDVAYAVFRRLDPMVQWRPLRSEGDWLKEAPADVIELEGDARALVTGERVALNFLQHLSGIATLTATYVYRLRGTGVEVLDTRKTTPGLRLLEKRAVVAGGGRNHRMRLDDAILVKDNHIALAGGVGEATRCALSRRPPGCPVEVECRTVGDVQEALEARADRLLLDNMEPAELRRAVEVAGESAELEASGGITLQSLPEIARAGLKWVSVGALTHSAPALDLSMKVESI